jgi:hypothetical protein
VDDFLLFGDDKAALHCARQQIEDFLTGLQLALHPAKTRVFPVGRCAVPGIRSRWPAGPAHAFGLEPEGVRRFGRRMRRYRRAFAEGALPVSRLTASVQSWVAHASYGQTFRLRTMLFSRMIFSTNT